MDFLLSYTCVAVFVFWLPFMPLFAMFFVYKCADLLCYKKLRLISSVKNFVLFDLLIVLASLIIFPYVIAVFNIGFMLLFQVKLRLLEEIMSIAAALVTTIVPLVIMHCRERKKMDCYSEKRSIHKIMLITDIIPVCLADALYVHFYYSENNGVSFLEPYFDIGKCLITALVFLLIKIVFVIFFVVKNKRKLDLSVENQ